MSVIYSENDSFAVRWLRHLIRMGEIADGVVDDRDIRTVDPAEFLGYDQVHLFAGIGTWSYAARCAGWPDHRSIWTISCPCQPFSVANRSDKPKGFDDERHLWPFVAEIIRKCEPAVCVGEQVANKTSESWFDDVSIDLEREKYSVGMAVFPACSLGGPHLRKRMYWCASKPLGNSFGERYRDRERGGIFSGSGTSVETRMSKPDGSGIVDRMGHNSSTGLSGSSQNNDKGKRERGEDKRYNGNSIRADADINGSVERMGIANNTGSQGYRGHDQRVGQSEQNGKKEVGHSTETSIDDNLGQPSRPNAVNGWWRDADWIFCRDNKWRPVESESSPLADGATKILGRSSKLRGYGNAVVAPQAQVWIETVRECVDEYTP
jgi:DNA (cytosine-5)-methyltransferase 1